MERGKNYPRSELLQRGERHILLLRNESMVKSFAYISDDIYP
jgi:hypothetical protein